MKHILHFFLIATALLGSGCDTQTARVVDTANQEATPEKKGLF